MLICCQLPDRSALAAGVVLPGKGGGARSVRQPEHALGDDIELHLVGAAVDGHGPVTEPAAGGFELVPQAKLGVVELPEAVLPVGAVGRACREAGPSARSRSSTAWTRRT